MAIRVGLVKPSEVAVVYTQAETVFHQVFDHAQLLAQKMPATTALLVEAVLVGLYAAGGFRPVRRFMILSELQSESAWREKFRWKPLTFQVFEPTTTCRLCFAAFDFAIDVFPEAFGSVLDQMEKLDVLELLMFLWGYNFDLRQMVEHRFFHDCHLGNIFVLPVTAGSESGPPHGKSLRFAWHDFGSHSYHSRPSDHELREFADKHEAAMNATVRRLGKLHPKLERLLKSGIEKMVADTSFYVIYSLTRTLEQVQNAIMKWRDPDARRIQSTMLDVWRWSGASRARISELQELAQISTTSAPSTVVWVRELARNKDRQLSAGPKEDGKEFEPTGNAFKVKGALTDVDDLKEALKKKKPNRVTCDADEIDIYSQQDGDWVKEAAMSASLRDTTESDCYGFTLPQKTDDL
ncbi:unnamed protein product [Symbiodinium sp. CCMP2592]|nr:unnamed protein product [Symbiodinium sp. CCMP2592]